MDEFILRKFVLGNVIEVDVKNDGLITFLKATLVPKVANSINVNKNYIRTQEGKD